MTLDKNALAASAERIALVALIAERDGSEFDGEVHLTSEEGERIVAALAALPTTSVSEPVAWRFNHTIDPSREPLFTEEAYIAEVWGNAHGTVTPLYAHPAPSEPVAEHIQHRHEALELARSLNGADFAGDLEPPPGDTIEAVARSLAIVAAAYDWTISPDGYITGLVAGDMGYAATSMKVDAETLAAIYPAPSEPVSDLVRLDGVTMTPAAAANRLAEAASALTAAEARAAEAEKALEALERNCVPLSADGRSVFIDGTGDVDLDWKDERLKRAEAAEAKIAELEHRSLAEAERVDAGRWRALMSSQKMHFMGSAGFQHTLREGSPDGSRLLEDQVATPKPGEPWHFGMEFWFGIPVDARYPDTFERQMLTSYVDAISAALPQPPEAK